MSRRKHDRRQIHMIPTDEMVEEAVRTLQEHEPDDGYLLAFSGGKDSIVTYAMAEKAGVKFEAQYNATGIDPPELIQFLREHYPQVKWARPKKSFWATIPKKGPPTRQMRWCCSILKQHEKRDKWTILGVRGEESFMRARRPMVEEKNKAVKPIFRWTLAHVWEYIEREKLPYPSLYDEGFDRIGCVVCPFIFHANGRAYEKHRGRWPRFYEVFEKAVGRWWKEKREGRERTGDETLEEFLTAYYRGFE